MMQQNRDPFENGIRPECGGCKDEKTSKDCSDEHYVCNQKLLKEIAARLPGDWEKLGIYLGIDKKVRDGIGGEKRNKVEAWGLDMFNMWWQNAKTESRWSDLQNALTEVHRHDLIQFTRDFFADNNVDPNNPAQHKMDKYFQKMAEQIPRDWKDIGIYLYLSLDDLHRIQMAETSPSTNTKTYDILDAWRKSPNAKWVDLCSVLEEIGRRDVIMYIEQEVQRCKQVCSFAKRERERERQGQEQRRCEQERQSIQQLQHERQQLEQRLEQQRQQLEHQRLQLQQQDFRPSHPPPGNYIPPRPSRFLPQPGHEYGQQPPPPGTALNEGAGTYSVQQNESVSRTSVIAQASPDPSLASPQHEPTEPPSQHLASADVNSMQPVGTDPSIAGSISTELTPGVAQAAQGIRNIHLDGTDGNISANTFTTDLTPDNTDDNLSLVGVGDNPNPSQIPVGVPSTSVSVAVTDVDDVQIHVP